MLRGERAAGRSEPELLARTLQVQGIWFQLLSIAEQNAAMRRRRQTEAERGYEQLRGTFAQVISDAAAAKVPADEIRAAAARPSGSGRSSPPIPPKPSGSPSWRSTGGSTAAWWISSRPAGPRASARR